MSKEEWSDIDGYCGLYQVSAFGRIKNSNGLIMKTKSDRSGYQLINLYKNKKSITYKVHRIVAAHFIKNDDNSKNEVNHKDEVKANNHVENLEWCDHKYNSRYGTRAERIAIKNSKIVNQYNCDGEFVASHKSTREIERQYGYKHTNISACCMGKYKRMYGSIWVYA